MSISVERVNRAKSYKDIEAAVYRLLAVDTEEALVALQRNFGQEVGDDVRSAVFSAQAFGDSVLIRATTGSKGKGLEDALHPVLGLESALSEIEKLEPLASGSLRDTVVSAVEPLLMNIEALVQRART